MGASSAFHLARAGLGVVVVDAFDGPAEGSTGRSFASVRARWAGARVLFRHRVTEVAADGAGTWTLTAGGRRIRAGCVVNAAGGWASELARRAGLSAPVVHSRRNVYATAPGAFDRHVPMTI